MPLSFLENVRSTEDGYLWMQSNPEQKKYPPLLPNSQKLWSKLHAPVESQCQNPAAKNIPDPFDVHELVRTKGLMEAVRLSIAEIEQMKDGKADKSMRLSVNRLKKQQTLRLNQASGGQNEKVEEQAYLAATLRTIKTLNSIRAIFPLLIRMFHHDQKNNHELEMNIRNKEGEMNGHVLTLKELSGNAKNKRGQKLVWLLGDYVYDTAKTGQFFTLHEGLWRILQCVISDDHILRLSDLKDASDSFWATVLPKFIVDQNALRCAPSPNSLFANLSSEQQAQVCDIAKTCDERYLHVFHHTNENARQARVLYQAAVDKLINNLRIVLQQRYRGSEVRVYGSCLSNLSLGKSSDVDISLHLPAFARLKHLFETGQIAADMYEREVKIHVYRTNALLVNHVSSGFRMQECVTRARVPVIKGMYLYAGNPYSPDGALE